MEYLLDLHVDLNSTSVFGIEATQAVAWLGVGWLIVLVSGFYVWYWPRVKRWARALRVRRQRGRFAFHLDLHNAIGIATILPMTLIVLTGINFVFRDQVASVYEVVTLGAYEEPDTTVALSQPTGAAPISTGEASRIVADLDPAVDVAYVYTPAGSPTGTYSVYAYVDGSFFGMVGGEHEVEFDVDQYSGRILRIDDPVDGNGPTQAFDDWSYPVHTGSFGGTITRWLWFLIGLTPFALRLDGHRHVARAPAAPAPCAREVRARAGGRTRPRPDPGERRMTRTIRLAAALTVTAVVLAGCGSTRFVVVESGANAAAGNESTAGATASTVAAATGVPSEEDARDIRRTITNALAVDDRPMRERLRYLEPDAEDLAETYAAVRKIVAGLTVELDVTDIATTGADAATATVDVTVDGASFAAGLPVNLVRSGGEWKVTRDGACTLLALASPCPDAS